MDNDRQSCVTKKRRTKKKCKKVKMPKGVKDYNSVVKLKIDGFTYPGLLLD